MSKKIWKDSQKDVDKLVPEFDDFCVQMDARNSTYEGKTVEELNSLNDPIYEYFKTMKAKLEGYTWNI